MTLHENTEQIRYWEDELQKVSKPKKRLNCLIELEKLWLERELIMETDETVTDKKWFSAHASGTATAYKKVIRSLTKK